MVEFGAVMGNVLADMPWAARVGRWWFQWRGVSPVPLLVLCLWLPPEFQPSGAVLAAAVAVILGAEALRVWAVGYAGSATRTRGDQVPSLVHAGPFRYVRNPLYLANTALYTAVGVAFGFLWLSVVIALYSGIQYRFIVAFEETILEGQFGEAFRQYREKVPRWFPALAPRLPSSAHTFDLRAALRSERSTLLALCVLGGLFALRRAGG